MITNTVLKLFLKNKFFLNIQRDCQKRKEKLWVTYRPSLFQHIGTKSSLNGKIQLLKVNKMYLFVSNAISIVLN